MLQKPKTCIGCPLYDISPIGFGLREGKGTNKVLIIGEALGEKEAQDGLPFRPHAESGSVLEIAIRRSGMRREDFLLYNLINCRPPNNKLEGMDYEYAAVKNCSLYVKSIIDKYKPKVILALGNIPLKHLWKDREEYEQEVSNYSSMDARRYWKKLGITSLRGYKLPSIYNIPLISSLHPSYIRRTGLLYLGVLIRDLRAAVKFAQEGIIEYKPDFIINPNEVEFEKIYNFYLKNINLPIAYDIETPDTQIEVDESEIEYINKDIRDIRSIQFSIAPNRALFLDLNTQNYEQNQLNFEFAKRILSLPNVKTGWNNWSFDDSIIRYHFGDILNGKIVDSMWLWKWLHSDFKKLGRGLQFAANFYAPELPAWKHLSDKDPYFYGACDADATLKLYQGLTNDLKNRKLEIDIHSKVIQESKTLLQGFEDDVLKLKNIAESASKRGIPIDIAARKKLSASIKIEIDKTLIKLQSKYPTRLRRATPLKGYKTLPKEVEFINYEIDKFYSFDNSKIQQPDLFRPIESDSNSKYDFIIPLGDRINNSYVIEKLTRTKEDSSGLVLKKFLIEDGIVEERWCRLENFKPNSKPQVLSYLHSKNYKIKTTRDKETGESKESTAKDFLSLLYEQTKDSMIFDIIYIKELTKMRSTYVGSGDKGWKPSEANENGIGYVHSTFLISFAPTGQWTSRAPNVHNAPKYGNQWSTEGYKKLADRFRQMIRADKGHVIIEADYSQFHVKTLAGNAECQNYMRIADLDIHSFVAAHIIRQEIFNKTKVIRGKMLLANEKDKQEFRLQLKGWEETNEFLKDLDSWITLLDNELKEKLKWIKRNYEFVRNRQAKPAILGIGLGMQPTRLYKENIRSFANVTEAKKVITLIQKLFPEVFEFQKKIREEAHRKSYLISRYGYIQRFYAVHDIRILKEWRVSKPHEEIFKGKDGNWWLKTHGTDSEAAIAFYVQNDAFGKIKEAMRELEDEGLNEKYGFINQIHDALMFHCKEEYAEEACRRIKEIMERPAKYLKYGITPEGLVAKVEVSMGRNWGSFDEKNNPDGMREVKL